MCRHTSFNLSLAIYGTANNVDISEQSLALAAKIAIYMQLVWTYQISVINMNR